MAELSPALEQQFNRVVQAIAQRLHLLDRVPRVRINAWLKKLRDEVSSNVTWQRNRNCYARLLLEQLRAGCLEVPFNAMPPDGVLPTLPSYLTVRFFSPPKQEPGSPFAASWDDLQCCSSSAVLAGCGVAGLSRPQSAGGVPNRAASPTLRQLPHDGVHNSWRVSSAASPTGSPASTHSRTPQQQRRQDGSPGSARTAGGFRRGYGSSPQLQQQQRPRSPGAAGLVDAAAAVAAELEAEREEAARMSSRLRFAEDKILQQEAELVRLQGAASAARRRIKSATSATLQELLERYGGAAAAWGLGAAGPGGSPTAGDRPGSGPAAGLADAVYKPVWQLLSGLQSVLDSCDQEEQEWLRAKGAAAAAALQAAYAAQAPAGDGSSWEGAADPAGGGSPPQQQQKGVSQFASEAAAAAAAEVAVLQHCERRLLDLQQQAEQLAADMTRTKEAATAAAGGRGPLGAASVAEAAAKLLRPMLKALRHEARDAGKLRRRLEAAAQATDAAAAAAVATAASAAESVLRLQTALADDDSSRESSSSGSSSLDTDSEASSVSSRGGKNGGSHQQLLQQQEVLAVAEQQQQQQGARLQRLQSASQVLVELDKASARLELQLKDAQQRLQDMANTATAAAALGGGGGHTLLPAQRHHDAGLVAAATAGIAASLAAGLRGFQASAGNLATLMQSLRAAAAAAAAAATSAGAGQASEGGQQQQGRGSSRRSSPGGHGEQGLPFHGASSSSSRFGDAGLAGTWGEQGAAAAAAAGGAAAHVPGLALSPGASSSPMQASGLGGVPYDAAAHYLIGAAAASGSPGRSPTGGGVLHAAAGAGSSIGSPRGGGLFGGSKGAFVSEQLQGIGGPVAAGGQGGMGGVSGAAAAGVHGSDAAVDAVHAQLAGLSRQASRLSLKASQILSAGGAGGGGGGGVAGGDLAGGAGGVSSAGGGVSNALRVLTGGNSSGSSSLAGSLRQREPLLSSSSFRTPAAGGPSSTAVAALLSPRTAAATLISPRNASSTALSSPRTGSLGGPATPVVAAVTPAAGGASGGVAGGSSGGSSLLGGGAGARSALLGVGGSSSSYKPGGSVVGALGAAGFTSPLLQRGALGGLGKGGLGAGGGVGAGSGLLRAGGGVGLKVGPTPGLGGAVASSTSSSIAAISSRLQAMQNGGR